MGRRVAGIGILSLALLAVAWAVRRGSLPPADYTFTNGTEIKSVDPAIITGVPERRIVEALFEGLVTLDPQTLEPRPAVAESWEVSPDGRTFTFAIRPGVYWTNGEAVTAHDFVYALRRFLDPMTAAEYAYQAWYLKNARRYSQGSSGIGLGDPVEVELHERPAGALPHARGEVVTGRWVALVLPEEPTEEAKPVYHVMVDGQVRQFQIAETAAPNVTPCLQILLDFREVGVAAPDAHTLVMTLEEPTPFWLGLLTHYAFYPVNRTCVETHGSPRWTDPEHLVCNGAYQLQFRRIRDRIRLTKNPTYWDRDNVQIEVVDALAVESDTTALNLYLTDQVDRITSLPAQTIRELLQQGHAELRTFPQLGAYFYRLNTTRKPLDDVRVRRALALAVNRQEIIDTATGGGPVPARALVPPGLPGYEQSLCPPRNPELARRLLADAGFPNGDGFPKLEILYNTHEAHKIIAELVRKQWQRELGVPASMRNEEWASYLASQRRMDFSVARAAWIGDYLDPNTFLDMFVTDGEQNNTGWSNPEYDALIESAKREMDASRRLELLSRAEAILMDELPIIPIYFYASKNMVKPYVRGYFDNVLDQHPVWSLSIDADSRRRYLTGDILEAGTKMP